MEVNKKELKEQEIRCNEENNVSLRDPSRGDVITIL